MSATIPPIKEPPRRMAMPGRRLLEYWTPNMWRWRERFSRENVMNSLRTLAWVVPLTILIWIYAEREQLATEPVVIIPIDVKTTAPNRVVTLISPADKNIT